MLRRRFPKGAAGLGVSGRLAKIESTLDDPIEKLQASVADAARLVRGSWLIFLLVGLYLAILGATTTHELLFKEENLDVPLLNVGVPVVHFYVMAPFLFLHAHLLVQVFFLSGKAFALDRAIEALPSERQRDAARDLVFPGLIVDMLIGHSRSAGFRTLLRVVNVITLCLLPPLLILWLLLSFLPYQDVWISTWQKVCLTVDLGVIWFLWPLITHPRGDWHDHVRELRALPMDHWSWAPGRMFLVAAVSTSVLALGFAWCVAVRPGASLDNPLSAAVFDRPEDLLARSLDVRDRVLVERPPPPELLPKAQDSNGEEARRKLLLAHTEGLDLRGRSLRGADLSGATISKARLEGADLRDTNLYRAELVGAEICNPDYSKPANCAQLDGSSLQEVLLDDATLREANLNNAKMQRASLNGANLSGARLQGAKLVRVALQGADLSSASLQRTILHRASLQGANLFQASMQGASLFRASMQGADLGESSLQGAKLLGASLQGSSLWRASLQGAKLAREPARGASSLGASLHGADLRGAGLWGSFVEDAFEGRWRLVDLRAAAFFPIDRSSKQDRFYEPTESDFEAWWEELWGVENEGIREGVPPKPRTIGSSSRAAKIPSNPFIVRPQLREVKNGSWGNVHVLLPTWLASNLQDSGPGLMRISKAPLPIQDEKALGNLLGNVACGLDTVPAATAGIARRLGANRHRLSSAIAAERMLDDCPVAEGLDEEVRTRLRALAERKDELRGYAERLDAYYARCEAGVPDELRKTCGPQHRPEPPE